MANVYWNKKIETTTRNELKNHQVKLLKKQVKYCYENSTFYRDKFKEAGITPDDIKTLDDAQKIPFTSKNDLRDNYPFGMVTVPFEDIVELHASSGTTGNPVVGAYTTNDMGVWAELMARSLYATGVRKDDVMHNAYGYGLFTGGLGFHYGAQKIGTTILPISGGMTQRQIKLMKDLGSTILCCTPSYAIYLAETMVKEGIDPQKDLKLKMGQFGAEPWSERIRERLEKELSIEAFDIYGLTELCGPGVSVECPEHNGLHIWEDHFYPEIIDPASGRVLPDGERGELVLTTLTREAMPLIRYRTRDLTRFLPGKCPCGRTHRRIDRITGRSDDMLIINGVNIFPIQIEKTLMAIPEIGRNYLIEIHKENFMDKLSVKVEINEEVFHGTLAELEKLQSNAAAALRAELGVTPNVKLVEPSSLPVSEGKAQRVYDYRSHEQGRL